MKHLKMYEPADKMITLIKDNFSVLQALESFGISLGFGDKTVSETCQANNVDTYTFLAVVNYTINGYNNFDDDGQISVPTLMHYLKASHTYFLDFQLPSIRHALQESIGNYEETSSGCFDSVAENKKTSGAGFDSEALNKHKMGRLIMKFYDEYAHEIRRHMKYEEKTLFPYVESLLDGHPLNNYNVETFSKHHEQTDKKLRELKLMIIKYLPSDAAQNNKLTATLYNIYNNEEWLRQHAEVEDYIFTPAIKRLERLTKQDDISKNISAMVGKSNTDNPEALSDREREVIIGVVQGLMNKEIADRLCISLNTVTTHRRNIARKLQIHSPAGLTIYAIVNGLVDISSVKL